jgi:hypothetical protein
MEALQNDFNQMQNRMERIDVELGEPGKWKTRPFEALLARLRGLVDQEKNTQKLKSDLKEEWRKLQVKSIEIKNLAAGLAKTKNGVLQAKVDELNAEIAELKRQLKEVKWWSTKKAAFKLLHGEV